jgi:cellulose synthase/poly-beta-1,6-N-acetylglucosamine synthase-like glycosyltransferase
MSGLLSMLAAAAPVIATVIIMIGILQNAVYVLQLVLAANAMRRNPPVKRATLLWQRYGDAAPPVALLSPAYNEEKSIVECVRSMLSIQYPAFEVIVINDGSKDNTLGALIEAFELEASPRAIELEVGHKPIRGVYASKFSNRLLVIDKENGGKADALNAGINASRAPIFCSMDADSLLDPDALLRAVRPFTEDPGRVIAVGGTIRIANGCTVSNGRITEAGLPKSWLALFQVVEYLRAFLLARLAWSSIGALTIISGAFGLFRRDAVVMAGGYKHDTVGEDMELVVRLHRTMKEAKRPYRIEYLPEPVCWTEAPESLSVLSRQRARWQRGSLETFFTHRDMLLRPRYGTVGTFGFLNILFTDILGPIVELLGIILLPLFWLSGVLSVNYMLAFLAVAAGFGVAISVSAIILEDVQLKRFTRARDLAVLAVAAVLENFGYRQINNYWRVRGWWQFLRGTTSWGDMTRQGFQNRAPAPPKPLSAV